MFQVHNQVALEITLTAVLAVTFLPSSRVPRYLAKCQLLTCQAKKSKSKKTWRVGKMIALYQYFKD